MPQPKPQITIRRPVTPVPLALAESFVSGEPKPSFAVQEQGREPLEGASGSDTSRDADLSLDVRTSGPSDVQSLRPGIVQRRSGRVRRRTTVYLEPALATRLAVHCATYGLELSEVAEAAILSHLDALTRPRSQRAPVDHVAGQGTAAAAQ